MLINNKNFLLIKKIEDSLSLLARGFPIIINDNIVFAGEFFDKKLSEFLFGKEFEKYNVVITDKKASFLNICNDNCGFVSLSCNDEEIKRILDPQCTKYEYKINDYSKLNSEISAASITLMKIARFLPISIIFDNVENQDQIIAEYNIPVLSIAEIEQYKKLKNDAKYLEEVSSSKIALRYANNAEIRIFRDSMFFGRSHVAIIIGEMSDQKIPVMRIHSGCYTGDLLNSLQCDCHDQLHMSIQYMNDLYKKNGQYGVIIYQASEEGRAIGLANKIHAYHLQSNDFNTVSANHAIGYDDDERDFTVAANMIKKLGINQCELITNNPEKISFLKDHNIEVLNRIFIDINGNSYNTKYLQTKKELMGHLS